MNVQSKKPQKKTITKNLFKSLKKLLGFTLHNGWNITAAWLRISDIHPDTQETLHRCDKLLFICQPLVTKVTQGDAVFHHPPHLTSNYIVSTIKGCLVK